MSKIITTDYGEYKTPGFWTTTGGVLAGSCVASAVNAPFKKMQLPLINKLKKESQSINNMVLRQSIADAFEASGLKQKGVEIIDASNEKIIPVFAKNSKKDINGGGGA